MKDSKLDLITDKNSALILVDYQPAMFRGIGSSDRTVINNCVVGAAKTAQILNIPVVLSSINPERNGDVLKDITQLFPKQEVYARKIPSFDAFEDKRNMDAVKKTGKKKIIIAGLWTSMCCCYSALHLVKEGYDVYALIDALGDSTPDAHMYGVKRMLQAGVIPITLISLVSEWMHDWGNPKAGELIKQVYSKYDAMLGM